MPQCVGITLKVPALNLSASNHIDVIDWQAQGAISEPLITFKISKDDLLMFVNEKEMPSITFPCQTQAVERCIENGD